MWLCPSCCASYARNSFGVHSFIFHNIWCTQTKFAILRNENKTKFNHMTKWCKCASKHETNKITVYNCQSNCSTRNEVERLNWMQPSCYVNSSWLWEINAQLCMRNHLLVWRLWWVAERCTSTPNFFGLCTIVIFYMNFIYVSNHPRLETKCLVSTR